MKLVDEHIKSYIDDIKEVGLLKYLTFGGSDVAFAWIGKYEPSTRSDDAELVSLARCNRTHYVFYRTLLQCYVTKRGTVLDVGCGSGQRAAMLSRYSERIVGIDNDMSKLSAAAHMNGAENIRWVFGDFMEWSKTTPWKYDAIFAVEVIEHVAHNSQEKMIETMVGMIADDGVLMITTPRDIPRILVAPHVGLWDDDMAEEMRARFSATLGSFSRDVAEKTDSAFCRPDEASHYVMVIKK